MTNQNLTKTLTILFFSIIAAGTWYITIIGMLSNYTAANIFR